MYINNEEIFEEKVLQVNRVSKKTKGGNKIGFSVLVVVGDKKGKVGVGLGKARDVQSSIRKAILYAKKHMIKTPIANGTIPHEIFIKLGFEGGQLALSKRLPQRRGIGNPPSKETVSIKVGWLSKFKPNSVVDKDSLIKIGLVKNSRNIVKIKIVDGGVLKVPVVVKVPVSSKARSVIEKALGKVELANG